MARAKHTRQGIGLATALSLCLACLALAGPPASPSAGRVAAVRRPTGAATMAPPRAELRPSDLFCIGIPDRSCVEFGAADDGYTVYSSRFTSPVVFTVGASRPSDWPFIHPSTHDAWAGGRAHTFTIRFAATAQQAARPQRLQLGLLAVWEPSRLVVRCNGAVVTDQRLPDLGSGTELAVDAGAPGRPTVLPYDIRPGMLRAGANEITITLDDGSWIVYDYVSLGEKPDAPPVHVPDVLAQALSGPMAGVDDIIFAVRQPGKDGHWYANFAYDCNDPSIRMYGDGGRLCRLNIRTGKITNLVDDPTGGVRDPQVSYDARRILFSWRKGGSEHYNLYEIGADGKGLRQVTSGPFDDIEPTYLPDGGIMFVSSRCNRWVNCWRTPVAVLYRCEADGSGIRQASANVEHDNTPWPLPDGRILYTRWEYVDRSQVHYHHLWTSGPDGSAHEVFYGNERPGVVMVDAKPIPGSRRVVASFSPGHGQMEHDGTIYTVDPTGGPDEATRARRISRGSIYRDPWAFSEDCFMAATGTSIVVMDGTGVARPLFSLSASDAARGLWVHEPRPLTPRIREAAPAPRSKQGAATGRFVLADVRRGRNTAGIAPGEVKSLLVLESLPKPVNFTGGMEPLTYGGSFTLERVLGTVPVEADGSASFEAPAMRSLVFVALDARGLAVKRMQSFASVAPGETLGCVGCHERRVTTPPARTASVTAQTLALRRPPSRIEPITDAPDVFDFPRDVQPILDRHCLGCHDWDRRAGRVVLSGDRGPLYSHSYFTLFARDQVSDGRNRPQSNYAPRKLGSANSPLLAKLTASHHGVQVSETEMKTVRLWIDAGAPYPGTYAALETGMVGGYRVNALDRSDTNWPETRAAMDAQQRRCAGCHTGPRALPSSVSDDQGQPPWVDMSPGDPRRIYSNHLLYNLTQPARSLLLLAPLATEAGGYAACRDSAGRPVFADTTDPDYRILLASCSAASAQLDRIKRFDMPGFRPHPGWIREMQRYGILPKDLPGDRPIDFRDAERRYWQGTH